MIALLHFVLAILATPFKSKNRLEAENAALRHQVVVLRCNCKLAGAKVVLVMGHTACGAIKGAIDNAELGNLTGLLAKIKAAVAATTYTGERTSKNYTSVYCSVL